MSTENNTPIPLQNQNPNPAEDTTGMKPVPAAGDTNKKPAVPGDDGLGDEDDDKKVPDTSEKKKDEKPEDKPDPKEWDGEYVQLEDAAGQSVINLLKAENVGAREANLIFQEAVSTGDLSKIKWDVLEEKLGKDKAHLARVGIEDYYNRVYSRNVATTQAAHDVVGGEANWNKVRNWVKKAEANNPKLREEINEIRKGIDAGGKLAVLAVKELKSIYEAAPGNSGLGVSKVQQGDRKSATTEGPIGRKEYMVLMEKAQKANDQVSITSLRARRQAGIKAGM